MAGRLAAALLMLTVPAGTLRLDGGAKQPFSSAKPLAWFHPPKTATSFGTTLLHWANTSLPRDAGASVLANWGTLWRRFPHEVWFSDVWKERCDHAAISKEAYIKFGGHFAGLFRQPEQRLISAWHDKGNSKGSLLEYAERTKGTVTMQLAGQAEGEKFLRWPLNGYCAPGYTGAPTSERPVPDLPLALERLRRGFMFVGLVEEYDLSVCLFHAMFGGECLPVEFVNMRPGRSHNSTYSTAPLDGFRDEVDGALYEAAKERFWKDVATYHVCLQTCRGLCPSAAEVFRVREDRPAGAPAESQVSLASSGRTEGPEHNWPGRYVLDEESLAVAEEQENQGPAVGQAVQA